MASLYFAAILLCRAGFHPAGAYLYYDGNPQQDFIKGLGIVFKVPLSGPLYNRHVRLGGSEGIFSESPKTLHTRRTKGKYAVMFAGQLEGKLQQFDPGRMLISRDCFRILQYGTASSSFRIRPSIM